MHCITWHQEGRKSLPGTRKYKILRISSIIANGILKTQNFKNHHKKCKNRKPLYCQGSKGYSFWDKHWTFISFWVELHWVSWKRKKTTFSLCFLCKKQWTRKLSTRKSTILLSNTNRSISENAILKKHKKYGKIRRVMESTFWRDL